ncbi:uncharacterized protein [Haliotis asinina]|uniref:uncharacterized protein n=1 Tax=Haliotis asinina TaxID=109174 RepID=UPI0035322E90
MKILFLVILVLCIGSMECQKRKKKPPARKNLCQKDIYFLVSVMRVCNAFRRATRFRMKNWPSLRKYIRYALVLTLKKNKPPPKPKSSGKNKKDKGKGGKDNKKTRSYQDDFSFDDAGTGNFFDGEDSFIPDNDDQRGNAVDDVDDDAEDSSDDPSEQSDAEAEIQKLRRYLEESGRYRDKRAPKRKNRRRPPKDPFRSLRIMCYKMSRLLYQG